jgi:predicted transcriptional regulator
MRRQSAHAVHPIGCSCRRCSPRTCHDRRFALAIRAATRALFLVAALIAIPFIIAHALTGVKGDGR